MKRMLPGLVLVLLTLALPLALHETRYAAYWQHIAVQIMLMGLCAMSWDLLNGYTGLFSFGQAAFFGTAAYIAGILVVRAGVTALPVVIVAALSGAVVVGTLVGILASRVKGMAVFLVTFACAEIIYFVVLSDPGGLTYGENGLPGVFVAPFFGVNLADDRTFYYATVGVVLASFLVLRAITRSRFGLVLQGIRENELRIEFAGYSVGKYKTAAFSISAFFAGFAGLLTALHERIASPDATAWAVSSEAVLYTTLGGTATLLGPLLGAGLVIITRELLSDIVASWLILVGCAYILLIFFLPSGLYPLLFKRDKQTMNKGASASALPVVERSSTTSVRE